MILEGIYRRFTPLKGGKGQIDARITHQESLAAALVEPEGFEMTRAGRRFRSAFNGTAPTGIATVGAIPTTVAAWVLWNGDSIKSYVMNTIGAMAGMTGTLAVGGTVLATIFQTPVQNGLAQATGFGIMSASASSIGSKAVIKSSITITAPAIPLWTPIAAMPDAADTLGGISGPLSDVKGRIIIPPQMGLGITVLGGTGSAPLILPVFDWLELESDLE